MADKRAHNGLRRRAARSREELIEAFDSLSPREQQVLDLLLRGFLNKEIAHHLELSPRTIEDYRASLKRKMGARTSAELVTLVTAVRHHKSGN
ncbi:response regulator transcription factor [Salinisphaera sp. LB1]|uniref:response regulator transcription factor n=1 Tax=Salinisphaera sp. LB1 TaxID=2183911 RepID=UPI000D706D3E|nr:LuxR C-terminal-related transcriptional regulator [Salinisphaera sp. LB1]AWN15820.1 Two-component nitrogen fixation transcriptional regulator FixJ [Salinisphaera sp. LB1]